MGQSIAAVEEGLRLPHGGNGGPYPAVILVGATDDGDGGLLAACADGLSDLGVASIRLEPSAHARPQLAAELRSAVRGLACRDEIDAAALGAVGVGAGAANVLTISAFDRSLTAAVLIGQALDGLSATTAAECRIANGARDAAPLALLVLGGFGSPDHEHEAARTVEFLRGHLPAAV